MRLEKTPRPSRSFSQARTTLAARLRRRLPELEAAVATRVYAISNPSETLDTDYLLGLRASLTTALDYAISAVEQGEQHAPDIPPSLLAQTRMAARNGVGLDTVLRRYFAGYSLLSEFVLQEAEACGHTGGSTLQQLLCGQAAIFDRLIEAVSDEHCRGAAGRLCSAEQRRTDRIERLLAGEPLDTSELHYDFEGDHLGAIAEGEGAAGFLRDLARELDRQLLLIYSRNDTVWAWLGGKHRLETSPLDHVAEDRLSTLCLAIGEPASGLEGWRLTHRQAKAALPFAHHAPRSLARYGEVALQASMLGDELLAASLRELYLTPLQSERDEGRAAIETLRAYFAVERNISSAGAMLGVKRHTVTNRLRAIERRLGRPLSTCSAELEAALCLENWEKTRLYERSPPG